MSTETDICHEDKWTIENLWMRPYEKENFWVDIPRLYFT